MTTLQKLIKYLAIAFGIFITVTIISAITFGITAILGVTTGINAITTYSNEKITEVADFTETYENIKNFDIDINISQFKIVTGDTFKVEGLNIQKDFKCTLNNETLVIEEKDKNFRIFNNNNNYSIITVYIPKDTKLNEVSIKTGVSNTIIENLNCTELDLDLGVGNFNMKNAISNKTNISTGAGKVEIENGEFGNLELKTGIGSCKFYGKIIGNSNIECGIGELVLNLVGDDYTISADTGIGSMKLDGEKLTNNSTYGSGINNIRVEGGIGEVKINLNK